MRSSNSLKIFLIFVSAAFSSCGYWQNRSDAVAPPTAPIVSDAPSEIPFSTKEPDAYRAEIIVGDAGSESADKFFIARNGANRLLVFDYGRKNELSLLQLGANPAILISRRRKIYTENESANDSASASATDFLTNEWLNQKADARFESLGAENNIRKYLVKFNESANSEAIIFVDEKINLPVREEFYTLNGEQKILTLTMELKNFSVQTEADSFEIPKDFRKVSAREFQEIAERERQKEND